MDDLENYCFHLYISQGMSDLRASRGNYDAILILRGVAPSSRSSEDTRRVIWMPSDGVL